MKSIGESIKNIESPESAYNLFLQQFSAAYENAFPKVKIKIKIKHLLHKSLDF